jgi:hypothetical protein
MLIALRYFMTNRMDTSKQRVGYFKCAYEHFMKLVQDLCRICQNFAQYILDVSFMTNKTTLVASL